MALIKQIKQENGVILEYHRINEIKHITNDKTYINVLSYINKEEREREKNGESIINLYVLSSIENKELDDRLTIEQAYEYLKTLPKYEGSIDG